MRRAPARVLRDELWSGRVELAGETVVEAGAVLFLAPGCRVLSATGGSGRLLVKGLLVARGLPGLPVRLEAGVVTLGGRLDLARCRVSRAEEGLLLRGTGHRLRELALEGCGTGLIVRNGAARAAGLSARDCRLGARVDAGGELLWAGGGVSEGDVGLLVDGGRASVSRVCFAGLRAGARVNAGCVELDGVRCRGVADEAVGVHGPAFVAARGLRNPAGVALVAVDGHAHLRDAPAGLVRVSGPARLCAAEIPERPLGLARRLVLATGASRLGAALYRLAAAAVLRLLGAWAARQGLVAGLWAHRSWVGGDWMPGASDIDLALSAHGLGSPAERAWLRRAQAAYGRARRAFPALGELLAAEERAWARASAAGLPRPREWPALARPLAGRLPPLPPPRTPLAEAAGQRLEAAWAYSRLMEVCARPAMPEALSQREAAKATADLLKALAPAGAPERVLPRQAILESAARRDPKLGEWLRELVRPGRAQLAACQLAADFAGSLGDAPAGKVDGADSAADAPPGPHREALERARSHFAGLMEGGVFDSLHRSYVVVPDDAPRSQLAAGLASWTREAAACSRLTPLPVLLTRSAWAAWRASAYGDFPAALAASPRADRGLETAGAAFPDAWRFSWGRWRTAPPAGDAAELAVEQAAAQFGTVWMHAAASFGASAAADHHLLSRVAAHALHRLGVAPPDFDFDAALAALEPAEPALATSLRLAAAGDRKAVVEAAWRALD